MVPHGYLRLILIPGDDCQEDFPVFVAHLLKPFGPEPVQGVQAYPEDMSQHGVIV